MKVLISVSVLIAALSFNLKAQEIQLDSVVSVEIEGLPLKEVLNNFSEEYDIRFSYSDSKIPANDTIYADFLSMRLGDVLKSLLHENDINYNIIGNQIVLFPFNTNQTIIIRGKVIDNSSGLPIPFANISLSGTNKGTSSNEEGEFQLSLAKLPSELLISHLAHEKKLVYVYDDSEEVLINLIPSQTTLKEITISAKGNKKSNYLIVKKAYDLLSKSKSAVKYGKAFYRQKSKREDKYTEIFEMFYDIKYSANGIEDWAVQEGRYAFQTKEEYDIFLYNKNFTLLSRLFPIQQPETDSYTIPVHKDVKKLYDLDLKEVIKFDERFIAVISYTPISEVTTPIAQGELYIDLDNYQVLKMKGSITDEKLNIISFGDDKSHWKNYKLDFQISFIDDQSGQLLMDFIQIDHQFDYYYKEKQIGNIQTSSILSFYEHYTPAKNKKLGGSINFRTSDMDVIDDIGYNSAFWSKNPVVKRTPLEEELIKDFELNEAFGVVFLNNEDEVVLLPDKQNTEKARHIISRFEAENRTPDGQRLFLRLDKENYLIDNDLHFTAFILDRWFQKPFVYGSVLFIDVIDANNQLVLKKKFDINQGMSYGEIALSEIPQAGMYTLKAYTNSNGRYAFEKGISISYSPLQLTSNSNRFETIVTEDAILEFFPESGSLLNDVKSKVVFTVQTADNIPIKTKIELLNKSGTVLRIIETNRLGLGSFEIAPKNGIKYFLRVQNSSYNHRWPIPEGKNHGFFMKLINTNSRSIQAVLNLKPAIPKEIYLLSTASGRVFSFYEKSIQGSKTIIDLPLSHLPGGVNTLIAMDKTGKILAKNSFFVYPEKLNIQLESAVWKSKRSNRAQINLRISDQNGFPVLANLNAICSSQAQSCNEYCDIRNYLYLGNNPKLSAIDLSIENDSTYALINDILISIEGNSNLFNHSAKSGLDGNLEQIENMARADEPVIAEINVSSNYSAKSVSNSRKLTKQKHKNADKNNIYWIPVLDIDERGIAQIDYKLESKSKSIYLNIQGVSHFGQVVNQTIKIDPFSITSGKRNK